MAAHTDISLGTQRLIEGGDHATPHAHARARAGRRRRVRPRVPRRRGLAGPAGAGHARPRPAARRRPRRRLRARRARVLRRGRLRRPDADRARADAAAAARRPACRCSSRSPCCWLRGRRVAWGRLARPRAAVGRRRLVRDRACARARAGRRADARLGRLARLRAALVAQLALDLASSAACGRASASAPRAVLSELFMAHRVDVLLLADRPARRLRGRRQPYAVLLVLPLVHLLRDLRRASATRASIRRSSSPAPTAARRCCSAT